MKRIRFGDVIEIKTGKGLAYAIYTHKHARPPHYGALIQVFDRLYDSRPPDAAEIATSPVRFAVFFPLQAAVNRALVQVIGNVPVPDSLSAFPIFRNGNVDPRTKKVDTWWLKDLETGRSTCVGMLTEDQRRLPILEIWSDVVLVRRIDEGWRPETDFASIP